MQPNRRSTGNSGFGHRPEARHGGSLQCGIMIRCSIPDTLPLRDDILAQDGSEFMPSNNTTVADQHMDFADWLEINNPDPNGHLDLLAAT
jgi:hypothetical protein